MKSIFGFIVFITSMLPVLAEETDYRKGIANLSSAYHTYMFRSEPTKSHLKEIKKNRKINNLAFATDFILEIIQSNNKILTNKYLKLPDDKLLKSIYIIRKIDFDTDEYNPENLLDSLLEVDIQHEILVDNYYSMIFTACSNKNKPFDFSKYDFHVTELGLTSKSEKGIFFFRCMRECGSQIWGYINIVNPPNTKKALELIGKFPKINGLDYYHFKKLLFEDFEIQVGKEMKSYRSYTLDNYYTLLLNHLICLHKENQGEKAIHDLLLASILKDESLYQYTQHKPMLERLFQKK